MVPAGCGSIREACFDRASRAPVSDLAERAALFARGQPTLRTHPRVLEALGLLGAPLDDVAETRRWLRGLAAEALGWRATWLRSVGGSRRRVVVDHPDGAWLVLEGDRLSARSVRALATSEAETLEDGVELTTDDDDSFHAGVAVALAVHSSDVERFAREYAARIGLGPDLTSDLALAGWLHDIGKADRRFQLMLRGGSEIALFKDETLWAKSAMGRGDRDAYRRAQARSGYPKGTRHEVQSVAMIEQCRDVIRAKANDFELVLHLVASHHGHCRPFAPVVDVASPVGVGLLAHASVVFGQVDLGPVSSKNEMHRLGSPLGDRFWSLVEKYGWLELCWLEAILRLADHRASEAEQQGGGAS